MEIDAGIASIESYEVSLVPSVGDDVHYISYGTPGGEFKSACRAAKITATWSEVLDRVSDHVSLVVFNPTGLYFNLDVPYDEDGKVPGTWHWPE